MTQEQRGGLGSTNLQAHTINVGLSVSDVRQIALDVFDANFARLAQTAGDIASDRAATIREDIVHKLAEGEGDASAFQQPEKQMALLDAQRAYALSGDDELGKLLVDTVIEISKQPERSLKSLVLQESLKVLPTLTSVQIQIISIVFSVRYVNFGGVNSLRELFDRYVSATGVSLDTPIPTVGELRHIEYSGCGKVSVLVNNIESVLKENYPALISEGFKEADLIAAFESVGTPESGLIRCLRDPEKVQIAAMNARIVDSMPWSIEQKDIAKLKLSENLLGGDALKGEIVSYDPKISRIFEVYATGNLERVDLTSVGIAVGHTALCARVGKFVPLDIWL